jgi:peptide/nickel transport system permease protein
VEARRCRSRAARDPPRRAVILLFSFVYVMINLAVDMIYTLLDPRIRY